MNSWKKCKNTIKCLYRMLSLWIHNVFYVTWNLYDFTTILSLTVKLDDIVYSRFLNILHQIHDVCHAPVFKTSVLCNVDRKECVTIYILDCLLESFKTKKLPYLSFGTRVQYLYSCRVKLYVCIKFHIHNW